MRLALMPGGTEPLELLCCPHASRALQSARCLALCQHAPCLAPGASAGSAAGVLDRAGPWRRAQGARAASVKPGQARRGLPLRVRARGTAGAGCQRAPRPALVPAGAGRAPRVTSCGRAQAARERAGAGRRLRRGGRGRAAAAVPAGHAHGAPPGVPHARLCRRPPPRLPARVFHVCQVRVSAKWYMVPVRAFQLGLSKRAE